MLRTFKILLPAIPLAAIGITIAGTAGHKPAVPVRDSSGSAQQTSASADSQSVPAVDVTVNGQPVSLPENGQARISTGSGSATIDVKDSGEVTTNVQNTASPNGNISVTVNSSSSGGSASTSTSFHSSSTSHVSGSTSVSVSSSGAGSAH